MHEQTYGWNISVTEIISLAPSTLYPPSPNVKDFIP